MSDKLRDEHGFSLVEVMIVVGIVALLSAIAVPNFLSQRVSANETSAKAALKTIAVAMENYAAINSEYPTDPNDLVAVSPPYLNVNYFTGAYNGYTFVDTLTQSTYQVVASPVSINHGTKTFTLTTGGVLSES